MENRSITFSQSLLFFWIKGRVDVTQRDVQVATCNRILSLIPAGKNRQTIPLRNISAASIHTSFKIISFLMGIVLAVLGFGIMSDNVAAGIVLMIIGAVVFLNGIQTALRIQRAGSDFVIDVPFYDKSKLLDIQDAIQEALNYEADKVDMNIHSKNIGAEVGAGVAAALRDAKEDK